MIVSEKPKRLLFLITPSPPSEPGEEFLSVEIPFLANAFEKVIIIHHSEKDHRKSQLPENFELLFLPYLPSTREKILALLNVFTITFWQEFTQLLFHYKLLPTSHRLASILGALIVGRNLKRLIKQKSKAYPDYKIYAYSYWCNFMAVGLALLKKSDPDFTCISRAHGYDVYFERNSLNYLPFRKFIYESLDRIYFISANAHNYAVQKNNLFRSYRVSKLGSHRLQRRSVEFKGNTFHIVSCSSVISLKRVHLIVEALALWTESITIDWLHFGNGPLLEQTQNLAMQILGSNKRVSFSFAGYVSNHAVLEYYQQHSVDAIVNVSESEGIPFSIIEAYSVGVPAIATCVGGVPEIVEHQTNGFLLPANPTPAQIHQQLTELAVLSVVERKRISEAAFLTWQTNYQASTNYSRFLQDFL